MINILKQLNVSKYVVEDNLLLFLCPYAPFEVDKTLYYVDSYYLASNSMYKLQGLIIDKLGENGIKANRYKGNNLKSLVAKYMDSTLGLNDLTYTKEYGSFYVIGALTLGEQKGDVSLSQVSCRKCGKCISACPNGAITKNGLNKYKCTRYLQENTHYIDESIDTSYSFLGCNLCQTACPQNDHIQKVPTNEQLQQLFSIKSVDDLLIDKDKRNQLSELIGANYAKIGKLTNLFKLKKKNNKKIIE